MNIYLILNIRSIKRIPSYFENVDALHSQEDSSSTKKLCNAVKEKTSLLKSIPMVDQFPIGIHPYIIDVVDVVADGHCGYRAVTALLGMGEESWVVVRMNLLKDLSNFRVEYLQLFGGQDWFEFLKKLTPC